jgi:hypothetical protein
MTILGNHDAWLLVYFVLISNWVNGQWQVATRLLNTTSNAQQVVDGNMAMSQSKLGGQSNHSCEARGACWLGGWELRTNLKHGALGLPSFRTAFRTGNEGMFLLFPNKRPCAERAVRFSKRKRTKGFLVFAVLFARLHPRPG